MGLYNSFLSYEDIVTKNERNTDERDTENNKFCLNKRFQNLFFDTASDKQIKNYYSTYRETHLRLSKLLTTLEE
jgi:hypothetical protein